MSQAKCKLVHAPPEVAHDGGPALLPSWEIYDQHVCSNYLPHIYTRRCYVYLHILKKF
jgi:hypothetical protein